VGLACGVLPWLVFARFIRISCFALFATLIFCLRSLLRHIATRRRRVCLDGWLLSLFGCLHHYHHHHLRHHHHRTLNPPHSTEKSTSRDGSCFCLKFQPMWLPREWIPCASPPPRSFHYGGRLVTRGIHAYSLIFLFKRIDRTHT
jgi:hypothetical protein